MTRLWPWLTLTLAIAIIGHFLIVASIPRMVNFGWLAVLKSAGMNVNELSNGKRAKVAGRDVVGYDNPDNMPSFMIYDVSKAPVRIHIPVIRDAAYMSIIAVDNGTNVFLLLRDRDLKGSAATIVLTRQGQHYTPQPGEHVAVVPTAQGIVLVRTIMRNRADPKEVARLAEEKAKGYAEVVTAQ